MEEPSERAPLIHQDESDDVLTELPRSSDWRIATEENLQNNGSSSVVNRPMRVSREEEYAYGNIPSDSSYQLMRITSTSATDVEQAYPTWINPLQASNNKNGIGALRDDYDDDDVWHDGSLNSAQDKTFYDTKPETTLIRRKILHSEDKDQVKLIRAAEQAYLVDDSRFGDKVDGAIENRSKNIATALYFDDSSTFINLWNESLDAGLKITTGDVQRRILEAAELNSLKCLEILCEIYEESHPILSKKDVKFFHRRCGFSFWPLNERPKVTALHVFAHKLSSLKAFKVLECRPKFLNDFADIQDSHGSTPLLVAIKCYNTEIAKRLLDKKPDLNKRNKNDESPIYAAALYNHVDIIDSILKIYSKTHEPPNLLEIMKNIDKEGHTILYTAAQSGMPGVLHRIMEEDWWEDILKHEWENEKDREIENRRETFACNVCATGCKNLASSILKRLRENCKNQSDESKAVVPLLRRASAANQLEIVKLILENTPDISLFTICDRYGSNVFHYAVTNPEILTYLLLQYKQLSDDKKPINKMNDFENTPIKLAAVGKITKSFKLLLDYTTSEEDIFSGHLLHHVDSEDRKIGIDVLRQKDFKTVNCLLRGDHAKYQPFLDAAKKGNIQLMEFLLKEGANHLQRTHNDETALHCAVLSGNLNAVKFLLDIDDFLKMIDCIDVVNVTAAGYATRLGHAHILKFLLNQNAKIMKGKRTSRLNILDSAYGYFKTGEKCINAIIEFCTKNNKNKKFQELLEDSHFGPDRIISKLVEETPHVARKIFDLCIHQAEHITQRSYGEAEVKRKVSYSFFPFKSADLISKEKTTGKLEAIESMVNNERDKCLGHPLVIRFLNEKMSSSSIQRWFLLNVLVYTTFLMTLTMYGYLESQGVYNLKSPRMIALSVIVLILCVTHFVKEIVQMVLNRKNYEHDFENYMEWVIYICAGIYVMPGSGKASGQIAAGAISLLLAWINFSLFLKRFSLFGIYVIMAKRVFVTVLKVLPLVVLFIAAFSISLSLLRPSDPGFNSIPVSLLTAFVMMTGELDYRDTFLPSGTLHVLQKFLLVLFILLYAISIMNLLTGLAVGDTNDIMNRSKEEKRIYKAMLVIALERTLHNLPFFSPPEIKKWYIEDFSDEKPLWPFHQWGKIYDNEEVEEQLRAMEGEKNEDDDKKINELVEEVKKTKEIMQTENATVLEKIAMMNKEFKESTATMKKGFVTNEEITKIKEMVQESTAAMEFKLENSMKKIEMMLAQKQTGIISS